MSDSALAESLSARPAVNSDVVFCSTEKKTIFVPYRQTLPAEGYWFVGGARKMGETAFTTIIRRIKVETGLEITEDRLSPVTTIEYVWDYRSEEPTSDGRHDINTIFSLELTPEELSAATDKLSLTPEYDVAKGITAFSSIGELKAAGAKDLIIDVYTLLYP